MYFSTIGRSITLFNRLLKKSKNDKCSYETALSQKNCIIANLISAFQKAILPRNHLPDNHIRTGLCCQWFFHTDTDRQHAADTLSVLSHPFFTEDEHTKGRLEVQNVVNNFSEYEKIKKEKMGHPPITGIEDIRCKMYLRLAMKILLSGRLPLLPSILASSIHQCTSGEWYYTQIWPPTQRKLRQR